MPRLAPAADKALRARCRLGLEDERQGGGIGWLQRDHDLYGAIACSMAPKMLWPSASVISMRTLSPYFRNGVLGSPSRSFSTVRCSARHEAPREVSWLAMVPDPTMAPAASGRVLAACATSSAKLNCMSTPHSASPSHSPL